MKYDEFDIVVLGGRLKHDLYIILVVYAKNKYPRTQWKYLLEVKIR